MITVKQAREFYASHGKMDPGYLSDNDVKYAIREAWDDDALVMILDAAIECNQEHEDRLIAAELRLNKRFYCEKS